MLTAIGLTIAYLAINLGLMIWVERERARERQVPWQIDTLAGVLRYGPPLAGVIYLLTISGDWAFALFVFGFFALSAYLMNGLLAYTSSGADGRDDHRPPRRPRR